MDKIQKSSVVNVSEADLMEVASSSDSPGPSKKKTKMSGAMMEVLSKQGKKMVEKGKSAMFSSDPLVVVSNVQQIEGAIDVKTAKLKDEELERSFQQFILESYIKQHRIICLMGIFIFALLLAQYGFSIFFYPYLFSALNCSVAFLCSYVSLRHGTDNSGRFFFPRIRAHYQTIVNVLAISTMLIQLICSGVQRIGGLKELLDYSMWSFWVLLLGLFFNIPLNNFVIWCSIALSLGVFLPPLIARLPPINDPQGTLIIGYPMFAVTAFFASLKALFFAYACSYKIHVSQRMVFISKHFETKPEAVAGDSAAAKHSCWKPSKYNWYVKTNQDFNDFYNGMVLSRTLKNVSFCIIADVGLTFLDFTTIKPELRWIIGIKMSILLFALLLNLTSQFLAKKSSHFKSSRVISALTVISMTIDTAAYFVFLIVYMYVSKEHETSKYHYSYLFMFMAALFTNLTVVAVSGARLISYIIFAAFNFAMILISIPCILMNPDPMLLEQNQNYKEMLTKAILMGYVPATLVLTAAHMFNLRNLVKMWFRTWTNASGFGSSTVNKA